MGCIQVDEQASEFYRIQSGSYATEEECLDACAEGACCETDGTCNIKPQCECDADNGAVFAGVGETCEDAKGACCKLDGTCEVVCPTGCDTENGEVFAGAGTTCEDAKGACCRGNGGCEVVCPTLCDSEKGDVFKGGGTTCDDCGFCLCEDDETITAIIWPDVITANIGYSSLTPNNNGVPSDVNPQIALDFLANFQATGVELFRTQGLRYESATEVVDKAGYTAGDISMKHFFDFNACSETVQIYNGNWARGGNFSRGSNLYKRQYQSFGQFFDQWYWAHFGASFNSVNLAYPKCQETGTWVLPFTGGAVLAFGSMDWGSGGRFEWNTAWILNDPVLIIDAPLEFQRNPLP